MSYEITVTKTARVVRKTRRQWETVDTEEVPRDERYCNDQRGKSAGGFCLFRILGTGSGDK